MKLPNYITLKNLLYLFLLSSLVTAAHPGVGIVRDSKGNIYYTDLQRVWKITNGTKKVIISDAHTHELWMDKNDNLFGEGSRYDEGSGKFYHCLWVYRQNGQLDTIVPMKEAYVEQDFSLARDREGREYYTRQFLHVPDTNHIYRKAPGGVETIFATGKFKAVAWLHPQQDGSILYASKNVVYKIEADGTQRTIKKNVGNSKPSFYFSSSPMVWGLWQDDDESVYAAVFSDQVVIKIDDGGNMVPVYKSSGSWSPLHGVFDHQNNLWVLEGSDENEVRAVKASGAPSKTDLTFNLMPYVLLGTLGIGGLLLYFKRRR